MIDLRGAKTRGAKYLRGGGQKGLKYIMTNIREGLIQRAEDVNKQIRVCHVRHT